MIYFRIASKEDIESLARLRIEVFRDFPYLYEGSMEYEKTYLSTYEKNPNSRIFLALDKGVVVGASSCVPMKDEMSEIKDPLVKAGKNINEILYFGESVLRQEYRGRGIGVEFFNRRENWARELGLKNCVFCSVIRPANHPLRPKDYKDLQGFWKNRGYQKMHLTCNLEWMDIGETKSTAKVMEYWEKRL